jgi:parallel beta-helix repeat protein
MKVKKINYFFILSILFIIFLLNGSLNAATYYVDQNHPSASDSNSGTEIQPWLTPQKAGDTAVAGDTVYFKTGTYYTIGDQIILYVKNSGSSGSPITFKAYPGNEVIFDGLRHCLYKPAGVSGRSGGIFIWNKSYIVLDGLYVRNIGCESNSDPNKANEYFGIWILSSDHITVQNSKVSTVRTVISYDYCPGITISDSSHDNLIKYNILTDIRNQDNTANGAGVGIAVDSYNNTIENNTIYNNSAGIYLKSAGIHDNIARYNLIHDTKYGIEVDGANNATVTQNILYNIDVRGIALHGGYATVGPATVSNNTIYNAGIGIDEGSAYHTTDASVYNNIIYNTTRANTDAGELAVCRYGAACASDPPGWYSDYNDYYNTSTTSVISWRLTHYALSIFYTAKGFDGHSIGQDPKFKNPPTDFHLQSDSPCINAGKDNINMGAYITGNEIIGAIKNRPWIYKIE